MPEPGVTERPTKTGPLIQFAAIVIILLGVHLMAPVVVPTLAALVVAVGASGLTNFGRQRVPKRTASWLALVLTLAVVAAFGTLFFAAATDLIVSLPDYKKDWLQLKRQLTFGLSQYKFYGLAKSLQQLNVEEYLSGWILGALRESLGVTSGVFIVSVLSGFLMLESSVFSAKVRRIYDVTGMDVGALLKGGVQIQRYLAIKTATSTATGTLAGVSCWFLEVPHAGLFGLLAFILNYIPAIGSVIAALPAVALTLLVNGWVSALAVGGSYLAINVLIGTVLEPRWMGQSSNLSPFVVVVSMLFWGLILGPVGALLSVPLTMMVRMLAETTEQYRWLAISLESPGNTHRISLYEGMRSAHTR